MQIKLELLAPAKNLDIGIAAIDCGADALYIAGPSFGAREAAGNSMSDIEALVEYAHRFSVKVYVVLNTILFDDEIIEAEKIAQTAWKIGCDALIIQDLGLLKANLPPIPLFASTQTNIRGVEQAKFLESLGFQRLILARELSIDQIKEIKENTSIDLETFIHGALCVSYSGQCYMSQRIAGRSANRGACVQACRSRYDLVDNAGNILVKNKPLLSLKDLNLSSSISKLVSAGITSFKIEGRLKNISYIKNIVRYYRQAIDGFIQKNEGYERSSVGEIVGGFIPNPDLTFNRGYTSLFLDGVRAGWNSGDIAKSVGEYIGVISSVDKDNLGNLVFTYNSSTKLNNGDGICFITPSGKELGTRASLTQGNKVYTNEPLIIPKGTLVYRNFNHLFEKELMQDMPKRIIPVSINFSYLNGITKVIAECVDGRVAEYTSDLFFGKANNQVLAKDNISKQLNKCTDIYRFSLSQIEFEVLQFYPASFLNEIRRELAKKLSQEKSELLGISQFRINEAILSTPECAPKPNIDYRANIANSLSEKLYKEIGAITTEPAFEISSPKEAELMRCKYCIKSELGFCHTQSDQKLNEPLFLVNQGQKFKVVFDCKNCEMIILG